MSRHRAVDICLAILLTVVLCPSCQKSIHQETERYIFVATNTSLPYWQEAKAGFTDAAKGLGVKADFVGPSGYSPEEQLKAFQAAVDAKATGILVSPSQPALFKDAINAAVQEGIPVICVDSDSPESRRLLFIGTGNYRAGVEIGIRMADILRGRGLIAVTTIMGQLNIEERLRGVREAIGKYPGMKITEVIDDRGDPRKANDEISSIVTRRERIDGIISLDASGGPGAAEALYRLGVSGKIPIVAMDKDPETLDWIKRGVIKATVAQKPYTMSFYGLKFLDDLHHNVVHQFKNWRTAPASPLPAWVDTGTAVVDEDNVEDFLQAIVNYRATL